VVASRLAKGLRDGGGSPPYRLPRPPPFRPIFQPITQSSFPHPHPPVIQHAGIAFSESRQTEGRRRRPPERHVPQCRQRHWLRTGAKGEMDEESERLDISLISG